ncbi:MAG: hypothetical protein JEZ12_21615 [Desulfobacterium sp.]|nr:hypothetical protein [Desulfobacterium sp.]
MMFDRFNSLLATKLPYRFRMGLVVGYDDQDNNGDTEGFGGGSDDGNDAGAGNRGDGPSGGGTGGGTGGGGGGGQFNLGISGPQSHVDEDGNFTGVVDADLSIAEKTLANLKTNLSIGWGKLKDKSLLSKIGIGLTVASTPTVAAITAVALGLKSLAQALDDPGLSDDEKKDVKEGVNNFNNLRGEEQEQAVSDFQTLAGADDDSGVEIDSEEGTPVGTTDFNADLWRDVMGTVYPNYTPKEPANTDDNANQLLDNEGDAVNIDETGNVVDPVKVVDPGEQTPEATTQSLKDLIFDSAAHTKKAGETYQDTIQGATDKQNGTLDSLIEQFATGTGMGKPVSFKVMGQDISFVPGVNRRSAETVGGWGQQGFDNTTNTAGRTLGAATLTDPSNAGKEYFNKIYQLARDADERKYRDEALSKGLAINQQRVDQNEGSTVGDIKQVVGTAGGIMDLLNSGREGGWW